jgi:hypothetical protein
MTVTPPPFSLSPLLPSEDGIVIDIVIVIAIAVGVAVVVE